MKVRRRLSSGDGPLEWLRRINPFKSKGGNQSAGVGPGSAWLDNVEASGEETGDADLSSPAVEDGAGSPSKSGWFLNRISLPAWLPRRLRLRRSYGWLYAGSFSGSVVVGYLVAAFLVFPAPFFSSLQSVPYVIGMPSDDATEALQSAGMRPLEPEVVSHPSAPSGQVVWQDPPGDLQAPEGTAISLAVSNGPQRIPLPDVVGFEGGLARRLIEAAGLAVGNVDSVQWAAPRGIVVNTRPATRTNLRPGTDVTLVISRGAPTIRVPDVRGLILEEARDSLETVGLMLGTSWVETSRLQAPGLIFRQEPAPGTLAAPETSINVVLARERQE